MTDKPALIRMHLTQETKNRIGVSARRLGMTITEFLVACAYQHAYFDDEPAKPPPKPPD